MINFESLFDARCIPAKQLKGTNFAKLQDWRVVDTASNKKESFTAQVKKAKCRNATFRVEPRSLLFKASNESDQNNKYGFHYFDKPSDLEEEEDDEDVDGIDSFEVRSCSPTCCDKDCECDDCVRCSKTGIVEEDSIIINGVAG